MNVVLTWLYVQVRLLGEHTDHEPEEIEKTISRPKYFDPYEAVKYGIIDRVSLLHFVCTPVCICTAMFAQAESRELPGINLKSTCIGVNLHYMVQAVHTAANLCYRGHVLQCDGMQVLEPDEADIKKVIRQ